MNINLQKINKNIASIFNTDLIDIKWTTFMSSAELAAEYQKHVDKEDEHMPDWMIGFATKNYEIFSLSPEIMPAGNELDGKTRSIKNLMHEITHVYVDSINDELPQWLKEGLSLYVAGQDYWTRKSLEGISIELLKSLDESNNDVRLYKTGRIMVDQIVESFGKEKLFELIRIKNKKNLYENIQIMFDWL